MPQRGLPVRARADGGGGLPKPGHFVSQFRVALSGCIFCGERVQCLHRFAYKGSRKDHPFTISDRCEIFPTEFPRAIASGESALGVMTICQSVHVKATKSSEEPGLLQNTSKSSRSSFIHTCDLNSSRLLLYCPGSIWSRVWI